MSVTVSDIKETLFMLVEIFESGDKPEGTLYSDRGAGLFLLRTENLKLTL